MKKTKIMLALFSVLLAISFAACGKSKEEQALEDAKKAVEQASQDAQKAITQANTQAGKAIEDAKAAAAQVEAQAKIASDAAAKMGTDMQKQVNNNH